MGREWNGIGGEKGEKGEGGRRAGESGQKECEGRERSYDGTGREGQEEGEERRRGATAPLKKNFWRRHCIGLFLLSFGISQFTFHS